MQFEAFLTRADDETLQELLTTKVVRLLRAMDDRGFTSGRIRELLLAQTKPQTLLAQKSSRKILLDMLRPGEAEQLCRLLGLPTSSPFEALAGLGSSSKVHGALLDFFELAPLAPDERAPAQTSERIKPAHALFPHQDLAARRCIEILSGDNRRLLLHMPTGAGKTRTAMHVIAHQLRMNPNQAVIWLAHSEELCEQAATEFGRAWASLGSRELNIHRFFGAHKADLSSVCGDFIVAGLSKTYAAAHKSIGAIGKLGAQTGLVVMDEAHQAIAPTYRLILDALVEPFAGTGLLGLSATPGRSWNDPDADKALADFFGRRKVTLDVEGYDNPVDYLIAEGYLAKPEFRPLKIASGVELSDSDRERLSNDLEIPDAVMQRLAETEIRNLTLLNEIEQMSRRHPRIIVFATTVEHSDLLAYALRARGLWARSVTGSTASSDRQSALSDFKNDAPEVRILCNFGVLTTGFDAPRTSAAVIARPTTSLVLYSQMVGRATRGRRAGGNKTAEIVTVVDSGLPGFGDMGEAFLNWEDVWEET